jgi:UDP-N-acetylglucosamine acyltransferase
MTKIHPTAIIDATATVAGSAEIGPYCVIGPEVDIGPGCILHDHVTVQSETRLGADNVIYPYSVIGADPQDRKFHGERALCVIGDRNQIREHVTVHRGTANGGGSTVIGSDNLIMVAVHIAHDCMVGDHVTIANQVMLAGHVVVEDYANIGGGVGVHHFATIGECSFVGAMARIPKDVPPYMIVEGNPAEVRAVNTIALSRRAFPVEDIEAIKDAFKRLYRKNGPPMSDKLDQLRAEYPRIEAIAKLCAALEATAEGVHGRAREVERTDDKRSCETEVLVRPIALVPAAGGRRVES